jgi:hypothetical protein
LQGNEAATELIIQKTTTKRRSTTAPLLIKKKPHLDEGQGSLGETTQQERIEGPLVRTGGPVYCSLALSILDSISLGLGTSKSQSSEQQLIHTAPVFADKVFCLFPKNFRSKMMAHLGLM